MEGLSDIECPSCKTVVSAQALTCPACGATLVSEAPPPVMPGAFSQPPQVQYSPSDSTLGGLIPTGNPDSLWAYYLGLFSILPLLGLPMGAVAMFKGSRALRIAKLHPEAKGKSHAAVGIGCGAVGFLINLAFVILFVALFMAHAAKQVGP